MNVQPLSLDHGRHSGEWDPSTSDGANIARYHVRQALAAVNFLFARARADNVPLTLSLRLQREIRQPFHTSGATRRGVGKIQQL